MYMYCTYSGKMSLVSGLHVCARHLRRVIIFSFPFFFAVKRCPIAAKIVGSLAILPCCVLNGFFTSGMNIWLDCEASLSHHTLCIVNLVWFQ